MFAIPSLPDLAKRTRSAFRSYIKGSDAWVWPNNLYATAKVFAGLAYEVFGFADYIARQKFAGTADTENLDLHAQEIGVVPRRPAQPSSGIYTITALGALTVANGAIFQRADGVQYAAQAAGAVNAAGSLDVEIVSITNGAATVCDAGTPLAFVSGVVDTAGGSTGVVGTGGVVGGTDVELDGEQWTTDLGTLRGRILFRKRNPPHGGSPPDYVLWASSVVGVTRVFVERRWNGPGTVRVFVLMDDLYPDAAGIPQAGDIARVQEYIDQVSPAGAFVTVAAPSPVPVNITISGLSPNTVATQEAVLAELRDTFRRHGRVAGGDTAIASMPFLATPYSFARGWIWQSVGNAGGVISDAVTVPAADVPLTAGQIPTLGTVTFSS